MPYACITGASSGIGKQLSIQLSKLGYDLILVSRNTEALNKLSHKISVKCEIISCDLSIEAECINLANKLKTKHLHILINNAGFGELGAFDCCNLANQIDMINVNIKALQILTHELLPIFKKHNRGYILNVASSAGLMYGGPYMSTYYATKAYVTSLTSAIYHELKAEGSNVHICMLCPGPVNTNFNHIAKVKFSLPGISASYCASYALKQMFHKKFTIVPTFSMKAAVFCMHVIPRKLALAIIAHQQKKKL